MRVAFASRVTPAWRVEPMKPVPLAGRVTWRLPDTYQPVGPRRGRPSSTNRRPELAAGTQPDRLIGGGGRIGRELLVCRLVPRSLTSGSMASITLGRRRRR